MTVLVDGKYYEDATYNTQFISVMNGEAVPVPDEADNGKILTVVEGAAAWTDALNVVYDALTLKADLTYTEYLMLEGDPA